MHHANHFYGHAHIMARYASLAEVPRIWGYLQHGWNIIDGYAIGTKFAPGFPKYAWSDVVRRRGWAMGRRHYEIVGSPWAYLLQLEQQERWERENNPREGTIVYPFHGWEGQHVVGSHDRYVEEIKDTETGPITICLYWNEYRMPEVRAAYERAGLRVVSHGYRGYLWKGTDTFFLYKQLTELRRHKRVVSNRLGSAIFYGASVGCEVGVYGDPMILQAEDPVFGGVERQRRLWPELHAAFVPPQIAYDYAREELGLDRVLSPTEIITTFGWTHAQRAVGPVGPFGTEGDLTTEGPIVERTGDPALADDDSGPDAAAVAAGA